MAPRPNTLHYLIDQYHISTKSAGIDMPFYKYHEAPKAPTAAVMPQQILSGSLQPHFTKISPSKAAMVQQQQSFVKSLEGTTAPQQTPLAGALASAANAAAVAPPPLDQAHFGHSLYFIEHLFPSKLWRILDDAERCGYSHIISWVDNGTAFQIHDREKVIPILEKFFSMSKYKSFLRQIQAYGFQRATPNPDDDPDKSGEKTNNSRGKWKHKLFRKDKMNLCNKMTRDGKNKVNEKVETTGVLTTTSSSPSLSPKLTASAATSPTPATTGIMAGPKKVQNIAQHMQQQRQLQHQLQQQQLHQHLQQQQHRMAAQQFPQHQHPHFPHHAVATARFPQQQHAQNLPPHHHMAAAAAAAQQQVQKNQLIHRQHLQQQLRQQQQHPQVGAPGGSAPAPGTAAEGNPFLKRYQQHAINAMIARTSGVAAPTPEAKATQAVQSIDYTAEPSQKKQKLAAAAAGPAAAPSSLATASAPSPLTTGEISEAANELRQAEIALMQRRKRLVEAQQLAQKEAEALAKAEATVLARSNANIISAPAPTGDKAASSQAASTAAKQQLSLRQSSPPIAPKQTPQAEKAKLPLTSLLEDLDNAFRSTAAIPMQLVPPGVKAPPMVSMTPGSMMTSVPKPPPLVSLASGDADLKITEEELMRARAATTGAQAVNHVVHMAQKQQQQLGKAPGFPAGHAPGPSPSENDVLLARLTAMERVRLQEEMHQHAQQQLPAIVAEEQKKQQQHNQMMLKVAMAEREAKARMAKKTGVIASANLTPAPSAAVRDALRNAGLGLVHGNMGAAAAVLPPAPGPIPGMLSKEMMQIFANTAKAAIASTSKNSESSITAKIPGSGTNTPSLLASAPAPNSPQNKSTSPKTIDIGQPLLPHSTKSGMVAESSPDDTKVVPSSIASGGTQDALLAPKGLPEETKKDTVASKAASASSSDDLEIEAVRALMRIPGSISRSNGEPVNGHWELVRPGDYSKEKKGNLPEEKSSSTTSTGLSMEAYKAMALKMSPPEVMQIPDGWDPRKKPVYLVIDPANAPIAGEEPTASLDATTATKITESSTPNSPARSESTDNSNELVV